MATYWAGRPGPVALVAPIVTQVLAGTMDVELLVGHDLRYRLQQLGHFAETRRLGLTRTAPQIQSRRVCGPEDPR
jgi:hypothetical protein